MHSPGTGYECRHSHENNVYKHTECSFNCIQREYSTIRDSLDSLNMLRMRSALHRFECYGRLWPAVYINFVQNIHQIQVLAEPLCRPQAIFYALPNNEQGNKCLGLTNSAKQTVREICRATYSASQTRLRIYLTVSLTVVQSIETPQTTKTPKTPLPKTPKTSTIPKPLPYISYNARFF